MPIADDEIVWVYRALFGRVPGPHEVALWRSLPNVDALRRRCLASPEFRKLFARIDGTPTPAAAPAAATAPPPAPPGRLPLDLPAQPVEWQADAISRLRLIAHVTATWTALGQDRPHWSVLSADQFAPARIADNIEGFYASGHGDVLRLLAVLRRHGRAPDSLPRAFEFGCGVGRVTPHLARTFAQVATCDISESHLAMAREKVAEEGLANIRLLLARAPEFGMAEPFDLWFSHIVLQHNPPPLIALILERALALLAPGGIAVFQVPTYARGYRFELAPYLANPTPTGHIEVHCLPQPVIFRLAQAAGCVPLEVREDTAMGPPAAWLSNTFVFHKPG